MLTGFYPTGYIHDVDKGDLNNDTNVDFALLSRTANLSTGNTSVPVPNRSSVPHCILRQYNRHLTSSWVPTCQRHSCDGG